VKCTTPTAAATVVDSFATTSTREGDEDSDGLYFEYSIWKTSFAVV
jgi:hypothetical protein